MVTEQNTNMKKIILLLVIGSIFSTRLALAQPVTPSAKSSPQPTLVRIDSAPEAQPSLFDLDFPGGKPRELIDQIEKQGGVLLNAIIPEEYANMNLPALKMRNVTARQLFDALSNASSKQVRYETGPGFGMPVGSRGTYQSYQSSYGFRTAAKGDNAVWYFYYDKAPEPVVEAPLVRFWQLGGFLKDYKIDDITTAIQTGWKLLDIKSQPTLKFHSETKLLVAVGPADQLQMIDMVLNELTKAPAQENDAKTAALEKILKDYSAPKKDGEQPKK